MAFYQPMSDENQTKKDASTKKEEERDALMEQLRELYYDIVEHMKQS